MGQRMIDSRVYCQYNIGARQRGLIGLTEEERLRFRRRTAKVAACQRRYRNAPAAEFECFESGPNGARIDPILLRRSWRNALANPEFRLAITLISRCLHGYRRRSSA